MPGNGRDAGWVRTVLGRPAAYRVTEIPRHLDPHALESGRQPVGDPGRARRAAALTAAYHAGIAAAWAASAAAGAAGGAAGAAGAAGARAGTVAFGWLRTEAGGPVRVIVAGDALVGDALAGGPAGGGPGQVLLSLPGGARGTLLPPGDLAGLLDQIGCWREVAGISDGLLAPGGETAPAAGGAPRPSGLCLDDGLLGGWTGPFGWLVIAEPLTSAELAALAAEAGARQRLAEGTADRFPERAAQVRRLKERHAELQRGNSAGFWRITVAVGGHDLASAARVAGLLCASADLSGLPYALTPALQPGPVPAGPAPAGSAPAGSALVGRAPAGPAPAGSALAGRVPAGAAPADPGAQRPVASGTVPEPGGDAIPASPFCGSTELLAALVRPPETEVPGVRLALRPDFDVTPDVPPPPSVVPGLPAAGSPLAAGSPPGCPSPAVTALRLGDILDRNLRPAGPFTISADSLNRHVFVCGATGAGKSQTVRSLLAAAAERGIPWLVVEPAKAEYRLMAGRLPDAEVIRIRPGEPDAIAAGLNPLEPAVDGDGARFPLQTHADLVRALFIASFQADEPFPQVLGAALSRVYTDAGWDLALGEPTRAGASYPALTALQRAAEQVVTGIGYSQRVTDDVLGFIRVRIASLGHGTTGRFLEGGHPLDFGALLGKNVVLEIEDVGDDADKAFLMGTVLIRLAEQLRLAHRTAGPGSVTGLRHLTVVEEAHRLLRRASPAGPGGSAGAAGHAVEMFAGLLAEIRAYGEGLIVAEQIPARLAPDVIKNTAVKIVHRLPAADDRESVGATMNATPSQSRYLVTLAPGQAAVCSDGMDFPVLVQVADGTERERLTPSRTADPRTLLRPRSATCGSECAARPCTLREMRGGQRALDDFPWVRLWTELAVLAHLTGWPAPVPKPAALAAFMAQPARVTQCALSHGVDAAVAVRAAAGRLTAGGARTVITRPDAFAAHVTEALRARAERCAWHCRPDEPEWLAAGEVTEDAVFGVVRPSAIEACIEAGGPLPGLLGVFIDCQWPARYLMAAAL